ncbi:hypothetical protein [Agromyces mariniharenae]|uniref:hypothetical protein n=1 Tax=Agromyces mariniharenae TaxID=2604423 RepID=UPI001652EE9F|nr:hypothetical protein [Agromyces mariniharenae]
MKLTHNAATTLDDALSRVRVAGPTVIHVARRDDRHGIHDDIRLAVAGAERRA